MEAGEPSSRQSNTISKRDESASYSTRNPFDRPNGEGPTMATAALISGPYHQHHPHHRHSYTASFAPPSSSTSSHASGMISPVESRRTSDDSEAPQRQSLPSIQEVISGAKSTTFSAPPPLAATMPPTPSLPSPFSSGPARSFSDASSDKLPSPRTLHSASSYPRDPASAYSDANRRPPASLTGPPNSYPSRQQPSPPPKPADGADQAQRPGFSFSHPPPPPPPPAPSQALYPHTGQLPPGQYPLPAFPPSPRQAGPPSSSYDSQANRGPSFGEEEPGRGNKYEATLHRAFEAWSYSEALHRIAGSSRTVFNFAEAFDSAAREQQGSPPIPSRLPMETEIGIMLDNVYMMKKCLEDVRSMVQQQNTRVPSERSREGSTSRKMYEEDDVTMYSTSPYGGEAPKPAYQLTEVKKRRGRAAPPGRCHSCNRIDTPEWRRGPDGARTLCNACGLHYAKLERKRQLEQRSIRPKTSEERS